MLSDDDAASWASDDELQGPCTVKDREEWQDHWKDELWVLWDGLEKHAQSMGAAVLDKCTFTQFIDFCFHHSSGYPPCV